MSELIEIRPLRSVKQRRLYPSSRRLTTVNALAESSSDSSSDDSSYGFESPYVLNSKFLKASKRNTMIQTLPIILNTQSTRKPKKKHDKHIQQFLINTQVPSSSPPSTAKKEIVIKQAVEPSSPLEVQYIPVLKSTSAPMTIVERKPYLYRHTYAPMFVDERVNGFYSSYESPVRRVIHEYPSSSKNVHIPKHAKKLVNRFLTSIERAHRCRYADDSDSDQSIDDCKVCRRLRSAMDDARGRSNSEIDIYRAGRVVVKTQDCHKHKQSHCKDCKVCSLLQDSELVISKNKNHSKTNKNKQGKHVHVIESFPSEIEPVLETTTTTTTVEEPKKTVPNNTSTIFPTAPFQTLYYPMSYSNYIDPNTGLAYAYEPNWQYDPTGRGVVYDYSSYYNAANPMLIQNPQYQTITTTVPTAPSTNPVIHKQEQIQMSPSANPLIDKATYTYMPNGKKKHKSNNKTVVVHTSRNPTPPPTTKIIVEQPRQARLPHKLETTTVLKERTTQTPHTKTTTYVQT